MKRRKQGKKLGRLRGAKIEWGRKAGSYDIEKIKQLREQGLGYREIAKQLGNCSYQTIRRLLQNTHQKNTSQNRRGAVKKRQVTQ